jgi:hypothetical protein
MHEINTVRDVPARPASPRAPREMMFTSHTLAYFSSELLSLQAITIPSVQYAPFRRSTVGIVRSRICVSSQIDRLST